MSFDLCALHPIAIIFVHPQVRGQECLPSSFACPLCLLKWVARSKLFGTGPDWLVNRFWEVHTQLCVCLCISCQANGNSMGKKNTPGQCFDSVWDSSSTMLDDRVKNLWLILQISRNSSRILLAVPSHSLSIVQRASSPAAAQKHLHGPEWP